MKAKKIITSHNEIVGRVQSKLILIREHSVVYREPAIALPYTLIGVVVKLVSVSGDIHLQIDLYDGSLDEVPRLQLGIVSAKEYTLKELNLSNKNLLINVESYIPSGKGL